jgi:hypothetical protein
LITWFFRGFRGYFFSFFWEEKIMSRKILLVLGLSGALLAGGCGWSMAHQIVIHIMSLAAGVNGLNELFGLGL